MAIEGGAAGAARRVAGEDGREEEDDGGGGEGRASPHADQAVGSGFRASDPTPSNRPARVFLLIAMDSLMALQYAIPPRTHRLFIYSPCNAHAKISRLSMHTHRCRTPISFYYAH